MTNHRDERIQTRAHEIWEREGHPHGRDSDHWDQATREIDAEDAQAASPKRRAANGAKAPAKPRAPKAEGAAPKRRSTKADSGAATGGTEAALGATSPASRRRKAAAEGEAAPKRARKPAKAVPAST